MRSRAVGWPGLVKLVFVNSRDLSKLTGGAGSAPFLDGLRKIASQVTTIEIEFA